MIFFSEKGGFILKNNVRLSIENIIFEQKSTWMSPFLFMNEYDSQFSKNNSAKFQVLKIKN